MALTLTLQSDTTDPFSTGDYTNPLSFTFDGTSGGTKEVNLLLKNTGGAAITVDKIEKKWTGDASSNVTSISFKVDGGTYAANSISPDEALAPNTELNFWMQVQVPTALVTNISNLSLEVTTS
jgi:hypothetical protein